MNDTIAAISTPLGVGAISIIRVSGEDAINIVSKIYKGKELNKVKSHTINYGHIFENNVLYMDRPYGEVDTNRRMYVVDGWDLKFSVKIIKLIMEKIIIKNG